jgi:hypothetical protein
MLGRGSLYFQQRTSTDSKTGYFQLGNCDQFIWNISGNSIELKDFTQQTTAVYKKVLTSTDIKFTIHGFEFSKENMGLATMGTLANYTQSAGSVVAEVLAPATVTNLKGKTFRTAFRSISAVALKQGATTFVLNTDYTIDDANRGLITILTTGAVADGTALTVDYTKAAITGTTLPLVYGAVNTSGLEGRLWFKSNNTTGPNYDLDVFNALVVPNGDVGLISEEFNSWTLEGTAQSDAAGAYGGSASSPYFTLEQRS